MMKDLKELKTLSGHTVTDMDIITICKIFCAKNSSLEIMDVARNKTLSDIAGRAIADLFGEESATRNSLKSINCYSTSIGDETVKRLVENLMVDSSKKNIRLKSLRAYLKKRSYLFTTMEILGMIYVEVPT